MKNSTVEIIAVGQEVNGDILFSLTIKRDALRQWLSGRCQDQVGVSAYLNEELLTESLRLFDFGQDPEVGDIVSVRDDHGEIVSGGEVSAITENTVTLSGYEPYNRDEFSFRYVDGQVRDRIQEYADDALLEL